MNVTIKRATFEITDEEAIDLFHALKRDLEYTIDTHWNRHPGVYSKQAASRLHMMRELSRLMHSEMYPSTLADLNLRLERAVNALKLAPSTQ